MLVRGEPFRAKFRNSLANPEPLVPGQMTDVNFSMAGCEPHIPEGAQDYGARCRVLGFR